MERTPLLLLPLVLCVVNAVVGSPTRAASADRLHCYVCGGGSDGSGGGIKDLPPPCMDYMPDPRPCPPSAKGCLTSFDGKSLVRSCGEFAIKDCKKANGVEYCYCHGRMCNTLKMADFQHSSPESDDNDDEDFDRDSAEIGSGIGQSEDDDERSRSTDSFVSSTTHESASSSTTTMTSTSVADSDLVLSAEEGSTSSDAVTTKSGTTTSTATTTSVSDSGSTATGTGGSNGGSRSRAWLLILAVLCVTLNPLGHRR